MARKWDTHYVRLADRIETLKRKIVIVQREFYGCANPQSLVILGQRIVDLHQELHTLQAEAEQNAN